MTKAILLVAVSLTATAFGAETDQKKLGLTLDLTYMSKWMSKGFETYGQQGGLFKTIDFDFYGTGFGVRVTHRNAIGSGYVDKQRFDYRPYFKNLIFKGERYQTNYVISAGYEHYPRLDQNVASTTWEWIFGFYWPKLFPNKIVPKYTAHYECPAHRNERLSGITGWVHRFGLSYDINCPKLPSPLRVSSEVAYNDGFLGRTHDWSYANFGLSTKLDIAKNVSLHPAVFHQLSMDDSVSKRDVTYAILRIKYKFK